ncbi:hypothetical protein [Chryseobacterium sp. Mn2064]|uniref:hypothetical protein n=1 Tax=Chryseobacterium sp. Mn2064 TaxID=3395263 RepID=UPI003BE07451
MLEFFLMLFTLAFSNNNANTTTTNDNNPAPITVHTMNGPSDPGGSTAPDDTSGETGNIPPPKK